MPALHESHNLGDLLKYEAPNLYSRDRATVAAGQQLSLGTVVGRDCTSKKLWALDPAAEDGSERAVGVLAADIDATQADNPNALLIARHAIVSPAALVWPPEITPAVKDAAIARLKGLGVLVRTAA
ncbi:hypothetical protein AB833_17310 [Chromatiales bacterium (ex Bugula neritina AB1)]|nr:hypothetical protein AB833_17310 [Chromatiales bacterium (ex Bugula neritina AB1)]